MKSKKYLAATVLLLVLMMAVSGSSYVINEGRLKLSVGDNGHFTLSVKDVSGSYYQIAQGKELDTYRLNATLELGVPSGQGSEFKITGARLIDKKMAGAGAPCWWIFTAQVQVTNNGYATKTVYVQGQSLTIKSKARETITIQHLPCAGNIILSSDPQGFNKIDSIDPWPESVDSAYIGYTWRAS